MDIVEVLRELIKKAESGEIVFERCEAIDDIVEDTPIDGWRTWRRTGNVSLYIDYKEQTKQTA